MLLLYREAIVTLRQIPSAFAAAAAQAFTHWIIDERCMQATEELLGADDHSTATRRTRGCGGGHAAEDAAQERTPRRQAPV